MAFPLSEKRWIKQLKDQIWWRGWGMPPSEVEHSKTYEEQSEPTIYKGYNKGPMSHARWNIVGHAPTIKLM